MLRLMIVSGPNRGASYKFAEGDVSIGRHESNQIVLASSKISKTHCTLHLTGTPNHLEVTLRDPGSSNGTFVNGVLVTEKTLSSGDRISVGEYVLEIRLPQAAPRSGVPGQRRRRSGGAAAASQLPATHGGGMLAVSQAHGQEVGQVLPFPGPASDAAQGSAGIISSAASELAQANAMPQDLKGKGIWYFENYVMPFFYGFNLKYEWKYVCSVIFGMFLVLNLAISVQPLMDENRDVVLKESARRATFMARQLAERNTPMLKAGAESQTTLAASRTPRASAWRCSPTSTSGSSRLPTR